MTRSDIRFAISYLIPTSNFLPPNYSPPALQLRHPALPKYSHPAPLLFVILRPCFCHPARSRRITPQTLSFRAKREICFFAVRDQVSGIRSGNGYACHILKLSQSFPAFAPFALSRFLSFPHPAFDTALQDHIIKLISPGVAMSSGMADAQE